MEWIPYGQTIDELKTHVRAFDAVFPQVTIVFGPGGYGMYMLGSDDPIAFDHAAIRTVLERPGVLARDLVAPTTARIDTIDGWTAQDRQPDTGCPARPSRTSSGPARWSPTTGRCPSTSCSADAGRHQFADRGPVDPAGRGRGRVADGVRSRLRTAMSRRRLLARLGLVAGAAGLRAVPRPVGRVDRRRLRTAPTTPPSTRAGRSSPQGDGANLYDPAFQARVQKDDPRRRTFEAGLNPFNNPPHLVLPFVPLTVLPLTASYVAWAVVQLGAPRLAAVAPADPGREPTGRATSGRCSSRPRSPRRRWRWRCSRARSRCS